MGKLVVSLDGVVIKEVQITKDKTTLGRRPYNDIVIDNLAVSGEHAVLQMVGADVFIEDLNSTNGTYINGKAVKKQLLTHNDTVEIGKYKIKYLVDDSNDYEKTLIMRPPGSHQPAPSPAHPSAYPPAYAPPPYASQNVMQSGHPGLGLGGPAPSPAAGGYAAAGTAAAAGGTAALIKVLNGAAAGREVVLTKIVTTVGKPGVQVASITKRPTGYAFAHVEGASRPSINGAPLVGDSMPLRNGDVIELAGTQMQFIYR